MLSSTDKIRFQVQRNRRWEFDVSTLHRTLMPSLSLALILLATQSTVAIAAGHTSGPVAEVRTTIDEATPVFANQQLPPNERNQKLRAIAEKHFDFTYMARSALGTHWRSLTPAQRKEFVPLFENYILGTYLNTLQQNTVEAASRALKDKVTFDGPDLAAVSSEVHLKMVQEPLQVNYQLRKEGRGWKLYDIVVDNVSTMASYRDQFNKTMNSGGYAKLVSDLRAKQSTAAAR
jgi:phospholipid transport system substrate-binding protein